MLEGERFSANFFGKSRFYLLNHWSGNGPADQFWQMESALNIFCQARKYGVRQEIKGVHKPRASFCWKLVSNHVRILVYFRLHFRRNSLYFALFTLPSAKTSFISLFRGLRVLHQERVLDTSLKGIDREGLGRRRSGPIETFLSFRALTWYRYTEFEQKLSGLLCPSVPSSEKCNSRSLFMMSWCQWSPASNR